MISSESQFNMFSQRGVSLGGGPFSPPFVDGIGDREDEMTH
jgi:hypothetical protein